MCGAGADRFHVIGKRLNRHQGLRPGKKPGITTTIVRCTSCDLIFANPLPIPASIGDHYGTPPESYWQESYFRIDPRYFTEEINMFKTLFDVESVKGLTALDVGAGIGKGMVVMEREGFEAYGIEPSLPFYERAVQRMNINPGKLQNLTVEEADFAEGSFDFINFAAVLEHLYDPSAALLRSIKWLKPQGLLRIEVPSSKWLSASVLDRLYRLQGKDYTTHLSPMHPPFHLYEFTVESFRKHADEHNYNIKYHRIFTCDSHMPRVINPLMRFIMKHTGTGMELDIWLEKRN